MQKRSGIDLVHDRSLGPVGGVEAGNDDEIIILVDLLHQAPHIEDAGDPAGLHLKVIGYLLIIQTHHVGIVVKIIFALHSYHEMLLSTAYEEYPVHVVPGGTETDRHLGNIGSGSSGITYSALVSVKRALLLNTGLMAAIYC